MIKQKTSWLQASSENPSVYLAMQCYIQKRRGIFPFWLDALKLTAFVGFLLCSGFPALAGASKQLGDALWKWRGEYLQFFKRTGWQLQPLYGRDIKCFWAQKCCCRHLSSPGLFPPTQCRGDPPLEGTDEAVQTHVEVSVVGFPVVFVLYFIFIPNKLSFSDV